MGVHRKLCHVPRAALPNDAFDSRACLPFVEDDGLIVEDPPAVQHVLVHADRRRAPTRVSEACQTVRVVSSGTVSDDTRSSRPGAIYSDPGSQSLPDM